MSCVFFLFLFTIFIFAKVDDSELLEKVVLTHDWSMNVGWKHAVDNGHQETADALLSRLPEELQERVKK